MDKVLFEDAQIRASLKQMARCMRDDVVYLVGILRGGSKVADMLQHYLEHDGCKVIRGDLEISFYRDDLDRTPLHPLVSPSTLPLDVHDKHIWLVDDVLFTGRTIRAALGELFDYGRPAKVSLAVLLDRCGRELPIQADVSGFQHGEVDNYRVTLSIDETNKQAIWSLIQAPLRSAT